MRRNPLGPPGYQNVLILGAVQKEQGLADIIFRLAHTSFDIEKVSLVRKVHQPCEGALPPGSRARVNITALPAHPFLALGRGSPGCSGIEPHRDALVLAAALGLRVPADTTALPGRTSSDNSRGLPNC